MRVAILGLACLAVASLVSAQTPITIGPVASTDKLTWEMSAVDAPTAQSVITYLPFVDGKPAGTAPIPASSVTCAQLVMVVNCQATPIPQVVLDAINRIGKHDLTLAAVHPEGGQSTPSVPFSLSRPTPAPTALKVIR